MRLVTAAIASCLLLGCSRPPSSEGPRTLPRAALVARAWAGPEPMPSPRSWRAVEYAFARVGMRYCWGGTGPNCYDCSGLVQQAWRSVGVELPRTSEEIAEQLPEIPLAAIRAGDILWWPGHVGLYAGNGWVVEALDHRHGIVRRPAADPYRAFRPESEVGAAGWAGRD